MMPKYKFDVWWKCGGTPDYLEEIVIEAPSYKEARAAAALEAVENIIIEDAK
jgi:hypothetical protein